jgi:chromosome segregation ATPase
VLELERTVQDMLLQLNTQAKDIKSLQRANEQLNSQITDLTAQTKVNVEEKQVLQATIEELEARVEELEARVDYVEAVTRKDGKQIWLAQAATMEGYEMTIHLRYYKAISLILKQA